jgi:hypothetical protein
VLWVGTDDGNVQLSTDGGKTWHELSAGVTTAGIHDGSFVGRIVASSASRGTAYVSFDQHRVGDFAPYIVRTTDFGKTWKAITTGLPSDGSVRSIQEYPGKANVVFAGTERYLFVSNDSGAHWTRLAANLPTTRYDDIVIHPRTKDLVLGTHGRSIWILDDASPIADWSPAIAAKSTHLFAVPRATLLQYWEDISNTAHSMYTAENPAEGATFTYHLAKSAQKVQLIVRGPGGKVIRELSGSGSPGVLHRVSWDLRHVPPPASAGAGGFGGEEGGGPPPEAGAGGGRGGRARAEAVVQLPIATHDIGLRGPYVAPGTYTVTLNVDGDTTSRTFEVRADPAGNVTLAQQKSRETFLVDVQSLQVETEQRATDVRARRTASTGADSTRLAALERRLTGGRDGVRAKLGGVARFFNGTGAQQGSFLPPTTTQRQVVADAKAELMAVEKELKTIATAK